MLDDLFFTALFYFILEQRHREQNSYLYVRFPHSSCSLISGSQIPQVPPDHTRIVVVSDTHDRHNKLLIPPCDLFVHCGDILMTGRLFSHKHTMKKLRRFNDWLGGVPAAQKIVIAGNHDKHIGDIGAEGTQRLLHNCVYLENSSVKCGRWTIWGTPLSHGTSSNKAFQSKQFMENTLASCPDAVDILITHGPLPEVEQRVRHTLHLCGHRHNSYGVKYKWFEDIAKSEITEQSRKRVLSVCAPVNDGRFRLRQWPVIIDLPNSDQESIDTVTSDLEGHHRIVWPPEETRNSVNEASHHQSLCTPQLWGRHRTSPFHQNRVHPMPNERPKVESNNDEN